MQSYKGDPYQRKMCWRCTEVRSPAVVDGTRSLCLSCAVQSQNPLIRRLGLNAVTNVTEYTPTVEKRTQGHKRRAATGEKLHLKDFLLQEVFPPGCVDRLTVKEVTQQVEESDFSSRGGDVHSEVYVSQVLKGLFTKGLLGREWDTGDRAFRYFAFMS
jgi:hypothetical protein